MNNAVNLFCIAVLLCFMSACAQPIEEKAYMYPPPPIVDRQAENAKRMAEQAQKAKLVRQKLERIAQEEQERDRRITLERLRLETMMEVRGTIDDIKSSITKGSCGKAERQTYQLFDFASSDNNKLESDLLTILCLCHLEKDGDVTRFTRCAGELQKMTKGLQHLDKETQLVLSLQPYFEQQTDNQRDPRIDISLSRGVQAVLKPKN